MVVEEGQRSENRERESRIYRASRELLLHFGYDKTTVSDIAKEAGISKGAIYLHFASKEALVEALIKHDLMAYTSDTINAIETDTENLTFVSMYQHSLLALPNYPIVQAIIRGDEHVFGNYLRQRSHEFIEIKRNQRLPFLKAMQAVGALRADVDMHVVAFILDCFGFGMLHASEFMAEDQIPEIEALVNEMGVMLERFLMPENGGNLNAARDIILDAVRSYRTQLGDDD